MGPRVMSPEAGCLECSKIRQGMADHTAFVLVPMERKRGRCCLRKVAEVAAGVQRGNVGRVPSLTRSSAASACYNDGGRDVLPNIPKSQSTA
jgi:hypothetical protein